MKMYFYFISIKTKCTRLCCDDKCWLTKLKLRRLINCFNFNIVCNFDFPHYNKTFFQVEFIFSFVCFSFNLFLNNYRYILKFLIVNIIINCCQYNVTYYFYYFFRNWYVYQFRLIEIFNVYNYVYEIIFV